MNTNKQLFLIAFMTLFASIAWSQTRNERLEAIKVAFITEKVGLTSSEAQSFWPIYNEYEDNRRALRKENMRANQVLDLSEADAEKYVKKAMEIESRELELKKQFTNDVSKVIPWSKVARLKAAERSFRDQLIKQMRERKGGQGRARE